MDLLDRLKAAYSSSSSSEDDESSSDEERQSPIGMIKSSVTVANKVVLAPEVDVSELEAE